MSETLGERRKQYIYGLWYPAALGTFAYIGLNANPVAGITALPWQLPLIFYFSAQFLEGTMERGEAYPISALLRDVLEILAMAMTFHLLYPHDIALLGFVTLKPLYAIALTLLIPPVYRFVLEQDKLRGARAPRYWTLTGLSLGVALLTALAGLGRLPEWLAFAAMVAALVFYAARFVFYPRKEDIAPAKEPVTTPTTPPAVVVVEPPAPVAEPVAAAPEPTPEPAAEPAPEPGAKPRLG